MAQLAEKEDKPCRFLALGGYWVLPYSIVCYWVCAAGWGRIFTTGM